MERAGSSEKRYSMYIVRGGSVGLGGSYTRRRRGSGERAALGMASFSDVGATGPEGVIAGSDTPDLRRGRASRVGASVLSSALGLRERCTPKHIADTIKPNVNRNGS